MLVTRKSLSVSVIVLGTSLFFKAATAVMPEFLGVTRNARYFNNAILAFAAGLYLCCFVLIALDHLKAKPILLKVAATSVAAGLVIWALVAWRIWYQAKRQEEKNAFNLEQQRRELEHHNDTSSSQKLPVTPLDESEFQFAPLPSPTPTPDLAKQHESAQQGRARRPRTGN